MTTNEQSIDELLALMRKNTPSMGFNFNLSNTDCCKVVAEIDRLRAELKRYAAHETDLPHPFMHGSEVDRLKAIVGKLDRSHMDALKERNAARAQVATARVEAFEEVAAKKPAWVEPGHFNSWLQGKIDEERKKAAGGR